jgi:aminoglycoside phosphotransferase (APT) family kinase protein
VAGSSLTPEELAELRRSEPDPMGLMDVMELIAPDARVTGWEALPGGVANIMHRIEVTMPSGGEVAFVLRRAIPELGWDLDLAHTAQTLESLRPTPVQAPELLWLDTDGAVFGRPALAMTRLPGHPRSHEVATDPAIVRGLADALVSLQWVTDLSTFEHLPVRPDAASIVARLAQWEPLPEVPFADTAHVRNVLRESAADLGPSEVALCHGDFHIGNVLFDGSHASGIVDWDSALLADPRMDLSYAAMDLALFGGLDLADAFLDAYEALRGPIADRHWWCLRATATTWEDVAAWLPGWHDLGIDIGLDQVHARLRQWTDLHLSGLRG